MSTTSSGLLLMVLWSFGIVGVGWFADPPDLGIWGVLVLFLGAVALGTTVPGVPRELVSGELEEVEVMLGVKLVLSG